MELVLSSNFTTLGMDELNTIDGGKNWFEVALGVVTAAGSVAALVTAPEITIPVVLSYYGGLGAAADYIYNGMK
ncbi:hypothetical protein PAECIP111892_03203 [Paenibacillus auburnensis]|uniref:Class IIb bacteriocin, lactobin A/cerein 7B family n=1 Tax=Paenibacillus auburnensis TaxID=2905649 RepID=A0ABN8GHE4_9BACL|nr:hypothetical protein [Paenibacillus auburnensis]CAH1209366.1 hypothetical protein PAECIP111892_03203 [Paenibacillus auburnensis]